MNDLRISHLLERNTFQHFFHGLCLLSTLGLTIMCIYDFNLNEDVAQIQYKKFHEDSEAIYPSITLCFQHPFISKPQRQLAILARDDYRYLIDGMLPGTENLDDLIDEDYDGITFELEDILNRVRLELLSHDPGTSLGASYSISNDSLIADVIDWKGDDNTKKNLDKFLSYVSSRSSESKCFTFDVPFVQGMNIDFIQFDVNGTVFPNGEIKTQYFDISFGYPNQFMESFTKNKVIFDQMKTELGKACYMIKVYLGSIEVVKRRNKQINQCNEEWRNHDIWARNQLIEEVGCNPNYLKIQSLLPNCSKIGDYRKVKELMNLMKGILPPCKSIEKLGQTMFEEDLGIRCAFMPGSDSKLLIRVNFNRETMYKEVQLVKAYNFQSLIGNAGMFDYYSFKSIVKIYRINW